MGLSRTAPRHSWVAGRGPRAALAALVYPGLRAGALRARGSFEWGVRSAECGVRSAEYKSGWGAVDSISNTMTNTNTRFWAARLRLIWESYGCIEILELSGPASGSRCVASLNES